MRIMIGPAEIEALINHPEDYMCTGQEVSPIENQEEREILEMELRSEK